MTVKEVFFCLGSGVIIFDTIRLIVAEYKIRKEFKEDLKKLRMKHALLNHGIVDLEQYRNRSND